MSKFFNNIENGDNNNELSFEITNIKLSMVNAMRRVIHAEIPCYCPDYDNIEVVENTSMLHEKLYAQRMAHSVTKFSAFEKLNIENISITIDKTNEEKGIMNIYLSDFEIENLDEDDIKIGDIFVYPDALIGKIKYGQRVAFSMPFVKNIMKLSNSSFSHSSGVAFHYKRDPKKIEELTKNMNKKEKEIFLDREGDRYFITNEKGEPSVFNFNIETKGGITAKEALKMSLEILKDKLENTKENIKTIRRANVNFLGFDFVFENEDDTLGNLVQSYLLEHKEVEYAGYVMPHPLNNILIIRTSLSDIDKNGEKDNKKVFFDTIDLISKIIDDMLKEWT